MTTPHKIFGITPTMEEKFHIGQRIKSVFDEQEMTVSEFGRLIHCERTNVYAIFHRSSIDVELLVRISKALNHNFFEDVMDEYGLTALFSPQLNVHIDLRKCSPQEAEVLLHSISNAVAKTKETIIDNP